MPVGKENVTIQNAEVADAYWSVVVKFSMLSSTSTLWPY